MKREFTFLMTAFLLMFSYAGLAQVVSGTTYSTPSVENLPTGWSGNDGGGTSYIKLIDADHYIQTANFEQEGFVSITLKARKFGGPSATQAQISVSWYDAEDEETVLGTIDPTSTTLTNYTINSPVIPESGNGYVMIQCKGASANKGAGVSEVTITYTEPGGVQPTTYTVTYNANATGISPVVDTYVEGANVTLRPANTFTYNGHTFNEWNTQANGDGDAYEPGDVIEDIQDNIELYAIWTEIPADEQWVLTNLADLTTDDVFVIVGNNGNTFAMANNGGTTVAPAAVAVTISGKEITSDVDATIQWTISGDATDGYIFYPNGSTTTWLYCTNSNNGLRVGTGEDNAFVMNSNYLYNSGQGRYVGIYNSQNWRSYTSINNNISGQTFAFYKKVTAGAVPPSISANNVEIAYNATSGSFNFTVNNPVEGGVTTVGEEVDWISDAAVSGNTVTFTTTANEAGTSREGVITLTYTYNRATVTANVTVTQAGNPNATMTIAEVRAQGTGSVVTTGIVTSCVGTTGYIQDNTAAICVYGAELTVGDEIRVSGTLSTYKGLLEITSPEVTVLTNGNTVEPTLKTIAEINADDITSPNSIQGLYVTIEDATVTAISGSGSSQNTTIAQGTNTIVVRGALGVTVAVNDVITLNGNIGCYNVAQIANPQNVEVQVAPAVPTVTVTPATINAPVEGAEGTLAITYTNIPELISFDFYFCDVEGNEIQEAPDWLDAEIQEEDEVYSVYYLIDANDGDARTAYFKVYTFAGDDEVYDIVTVNQEAYVAPTFATLPFEFNGGKADIENTDGLYQEGLGSDYNSAPKLKFDGTGDWLLLQFEGVPGELAFDIKGNTFSGGTFTVQTSEDGEEYTDLATFTELGSTEHMTYNTLGEDVRYIKWIYTEKVNGNVALGNITLAAYTGPVASITVDPELVEVDANEHDGTLDLSYENIEVESFEDFGIQYYDAEGEEAEEPDWVEVLVAEQDPSIGEGYVVSYYMIENEGEARTAYFKVYALDANAEWVYSNLVTISQAAYEPPFTGTTYTLATAIESGRHYIITNGSDRAMGAQNVSNSGAQGNNRTAVEINTVDGVAQVSSADVVEFVINGPDADGNYFIYDASYDADFYGYLYAASSTANQLKTEEFLDANGNGLWSIEIAEDGVATVTAQGDHTRNMMRYNSGSSIFACYAGGQQDIYLFMKDEDETYEFFKDIAGYGESDGDYYLVATPFDDVDPASVNMFTYDYDLYYFDQTATGEEWQNYKANPFNLAMGMGYLYVSKQNVTLHFQGESIFDEASVELPLENVGDNLIGNPYACIANVEGDFYIVNEDGTDVTLSDRTYVNPMEGIFVEAQTEGQAFTFTKNTGAGGSGFEPGGSYKLDLKVNDNNGRGDLARIRFGEGNDLHKFMINPANTKLYIPTEDADYAVVYADNMGEMPVNFSAAVDGTYTLTVDAGDMEMDYLHLIDNMTGMDVNLLVNPSYSFEATVNDNAARFTLVFAHLTGIEENNTNTFAFFSNGNFIIANQGNATLQVVDLNGRILKSEVISDSASVNVDAAPGVYMIRLINGDNVKVQKIVVR